MMHMEWMDDCLYRLYHCEKRTCCCGCTILRRGLTVVDYCLRRGPIDVCCSWNGCGVLIQAVSLQEEDACHS